MWKRTARIIWQVVRSGKQEENVMVFYINKQAVEIKTRFENAPLTSPNEACAAIGMLCKLYGLPIPENGRWSAR